MDNFKDDTASTFDLLSTYLHQGFHTTWYLGVILSSLASLAGAVGDNLVRLSFISESRRLPQNIRALHRRPLWVIGEILAVFMNPILTVLALKFAAASVVLPFGGLHIFWNVMLVGYVLREQIYAADFVGSFAILAGIVLVVSFGAHKVPAYTVDAMTLAVCQPLFILYLFIVSLFIAFCFSVTHFHRNALFALRSFKQKQPLSTEIPDVSCDPNVAKHSSFTSPPIWLQRICVASICGAIGGMGNLAAKALMEMIGVEGLAKCLQRIEFYLAGMLTLTLCSIQLLYLNLALYRFEAKYVVPLVNAALIASGSAGGMVLFREYTHMTYFTFCGFSVGSVLVITGIITLAAAAAGAGAVCGQQRDFVANASKSFGQSAFADFDDECMGLCTHNKVPCPIPAKPFS